MAVLQLPANNAKGNTLLAASHKKATRADLIHTHRMVAINNNTRRDSADANTL